jgi:hypothetical protein
MINARTQQLLLLNVSNRLKKKVTAYAIGGTAMMLMGLKESTQDIDLVFTSDRDRKIFKDALEAIGYHKMDTVKIYFDRKNKPEMLTLVDERFNLFVNEVISFVFSETMQQRSEQRIHRFGKTLILQVADPHDIMLMKCATDRTKDADDVKSIMERTSVNWGLVIDEAKEQIALGKEMAAFELGCFLERLKLELDAAVPQKVLDDLFEVVQRQAKEKRKKERRLKGRKVANPRNPSKSVPVR